MPSSPEEVVREVGKRLGQPRLGKDALIKLLKQAENALSEFSQSSSLQDTLHALNKSLVQTTLLKHRDKDVKILVAVCFIEVMRVLAPDPPFSDENLKELSNHQEFHTFISVFQCSLCWTYPSYVQLKLRHGLQQSVYHAMQSVVTQLLNERVTQPLVDVILRNLVKDDKGTSRRLAVDIIKCCADKLEPAICIFLSSCIFDKDMPVNELKKLHHKIILEIFQCAPQILSAVIPSLTHELLSDQIDIRLEAVHLIGRLLALSNLRFGQDNKLVFIEFLKRFSDKSAEVRIAAIDAAKSCYMDALCGFEAKEILKSLEGRLLDFDDKVRIRAVHTVSVRKNVMHKLLELYRDYCEKCSKGTATINTHYEQIPAKLIVLCFDKDIESFRPQNMELIFSEELFPSSLSPKERAIHWIEFFSHFKHEHIKALNIIFSQKRRNELISYSDSACDLLLCWMQSNSALLSYMSSSDSDSSPEFPEPKNCDNLHLVMATLSTEVAKVFPSLFQGSEEYLLKLFSEESVLINEKTLQMLANLAKSMQHLPTTFSNAVYPFLEQKCIEGTRTESKYAIIAIDSLHPSDDKKFAKLYKKVVSGLSDNQNVPTLLQSWGSILEHSPSMHELDCRQIINSIQDILLSTELISSSGESSIDDSSACSSPIYCLKALVKSCLPRSTAPTRINSVQGMLLKFEKGLFQDIALCEDDKPYLKLAAGKSVLRLATRWDSHVSPELFRNTVLMARDSSYIVRKSFICKLYDLLKKRAIPVRYACAFALASTDSCSDVRTESTSYLSEVLKEQQRFLFHQKRASKDSIVDNPAYAMVFLIHILAYDGRFPSMGCENETSFPELCRTEHGPATSSVSVLLGIFRAIQKAEDPADTNITPKLHILSKIGLRIVKELDKHCKMSDSPRHILLPSSYYKLSGSESKPDECCQENSISDSLVKRILEAHEPYQDNKCSVAAERVSNESALGKGACSSLSKLVGENASGCNKEKGNISFSLRKPGPRKRIRNRIGVMTITGESKIDFFDFFDNNLMCVAASLSDMGSLALVISCIQYSVTHSFKKDHGSQKLTVPKSLSGSHKHEMLLPGSSIVCSDLEDVGDCDDNFVKLPLSKNKTVVPFAADLKKRGKRPLELTSEENRSGVTGVGVRDNIEDGILLYMHELDAEGLDTTRDS
ncbi:hypothetical protein PR202_gb04079 [Eleusine coracana subsp. coracana]|uniref:Uncharacterized protein n=1 Tax=Eleusine coracana subsp. coracana TaxID=191504 RepID=A0AAV5E3E8_ELECO|nr:hypothetical protein PR202_gb04079 [Eleusine coracana subsp. coracana]